MGLDVVEEGIILIQYVEYTRGPSSHHQTLRQPVHRSKHGSAVQCAAVLRRSPPGPHARQQRLPRCLLRHHRHLSAHQSISKLLNVVLLIRTRDH